MLLWVSIKQCDPNKGLPRDFLSLRIDAGWNFKSRDDPEPYQDDRSGKVNGTAYRVDAGPDETYQEARSAARYFAFLFDEKFMKTGNVAESFDYAMDAIED